MSPENEGFLRHLQVIESIGKRLGTVSLGQMPEAGQTTLTTPLTALIQDILQHGDAQGLRLVYLSDDGYHPSDYDHNGLNEALALPRWLVWRSARACRPVGQGRG